MSHYSKIPVLLDNLMMCSMAEAARRVGISHALPWQWLVQSRLGKAELQEIEFCGVVAPYHVQLENVKLLSVAAIEQSAVERALNGCYVDVFFQGQRQYETVLKLEFAGKDDDTLAIEVGADYKKICYETIAAKQWLKPSDALVIKMLESFKRKRYGAHQTIDVNYGGVLRLEKDSKPDAPIIDVTPIAAFPIAASPRVTDCAAFEDEPQDAAEQRGGHLALAAPATSSADFEARAAAGEFDPAPVAFMNAEGKATALRPDIEALRQQVVDLRKNGPKVRQPSHHVQVFTADDRPDKAVVSQDGESLAEPYSPPQRPPAPQVGTPRPITTAEERRVGTGRESLGDGPDPNMVGGARGFRVA